MIIVYTVLTNNYDWLKKVEPIEGVRFVCFTDDTDRDCLGWELREAKYHNRWYKWHSHLLFPTDTSIYIDASCKLTKTPQELVQELADKSILQCNHEMRTCVYKEAQQVINYNLASPVDVNKWVAYLKEAEYPKDYGLYRNGLIVRKSNYFVKKFNELVWSLMQQFNLFRDQLIVMYVYFLLGLEETVVVPRNHCFVWEGHNK